MKPIVQISLDLTNIDEALETAALAMRAGVDWLEAGTPLILAEGLHGVRASAQSLPHDAHRRRPEDHGRRLLSKQK
jgi:3-hexulose-6-phosphate synthase